MTALHHMPRQQVYGIVALLFILSGVTGLMYQIVWFKYLTLFLGNTTYAQTIVLATFMAGLAIGASLWGRRADRTRRPLFIYALLEAGIGVYCLLYPALLGILREGFIQTVRSLGWASDGAEVLLLKLLVSVLSLLLPTILMGGTLPVLVKSLSVSVEESGRTIATLYFLNSFGAVVGSVLGGFFFIPIVGLRATVYAAGVTNVVIGALAAMVARLVGSQPAADSIAEEGPVSVFSSRQVSAAIIVAGVSGFAAMVYEVTWVRLLIPVLGSSTYSYTLMVVAFISGISIGSWIVSMLIVRIKNLFGFLALCQVAVGLSLALTLPLYGRIPYYFWHLGSILTRSETTYPIFLSLQFLFGFLVMIVPTIFLGMTLPVASRIAARSLTFLGRSVGNVFSVNTAGTVAGALVAGLLLIPLIGIRKTIEVGMVLNILAGTWIAIQDTVWTRTKRTAAVLFGAVPLVVYFIVAPQWTRSVLLSGVFRQLTNNFPPPATFADFDRSGKAVEILYYKEGASATVGVIKSQHGAGQQAVLIINGKADASSVKDLPTQILLGQLPLLLHPEPKDALVIGYGSGVTTGSILTHPVSAVMSVEISPEVVEAAVHFDDVNRRPLDDRRSSLVIDDALSFLKLSDRQFDVIVSEPSNPWIAGIGSLYTAEFFEECRRKLREGGLMVQWYHLYEIDDEVFRLVVRTLLSVFPHVTLWQSLSGDVVMIGGVQPLALNAAQLQERMEIEAVRDDLRRIDIPDAATLLSLQVLSEDRVREYAMIGPLNTEDRPILEHGAPRAFFINRGVRGLERMDERRSFGGSSILLKRFLQARRLTGEERLNIGLLHAAPERGSAQLAFSVLTEYLESNPADIRALRAIADLAERVGRIDLALDFRARLARLVPDDPEILEQYASLRFTAERPLISSFSTYDAENPERLLLRCVELTGDSVDYYRVKLGDLNYSMQRFTAARDNYRRALLIRERYAPDPRIRQDALLTQYAKCFWHLGDNGRAVGYALQSININPRNEEARDLIATVWAARGRGDTTTSR